MNRPSAITACGFSIALLLLTNTAVAAEEAAWPVRLQYAAHPGCPDALYFFHSARQRSSRVRPAFPGESAATATVTISSAGAGSAGTLTIAGMAALPFTRSIEANTCAEVVQAMALMLALAFDPDASEPEPPPPPKPPEPLPVPQSPAAPPVVQRVEVPVPGLDRVAAGIQGALESSTSPSLRPVAGLYVAYQSLRDPVLRPRVELSVLFSSDQTFQASAGQVTLGFQGGKLAVCPVGLILAAGSLELMPCLALAAGRIVGEGDPALPVQHAETRWWSALSGLGALRWGATDALFFQAGAGLGVTLVRAEFILDGARAFRVPALAGELNLAAGIDFR